MQKDTIYLRLLIGFGALLLMANSPVKAERITSQRLMYSVDYAGQNAGDLEVIIENQGNQIEVTSHTHLSILAKVFLTAQTSKAQFSMSGGIPRILGGADYKRKDLSLIRQFTVNGDAVTLDSGETLVVPQGDLLEADLFPIRLMASDFSSLGGKTIRVISGKRMRVDQIETPVQEQITTPRGTINTWRITRFRADDPGNRVTYWFDELKRPAQIVSTRKGKNTILTLLP